MTKLKEATKVAKENNVQAPKVYDVSEMTKDEIKAISDLHVRRKLLLEYGKQLAKTNVVKHNVRAKASNAPNFASREYCELLYNNSLEGKETTIEDLLKLEGWNHKTLYKELGTLVESLEAKFQSGKVDNINQLYIESLKKQFVNDLVNNQFANVELFKDLYELFSKIDIENSEKGKRETDKLKAVAFQQQFGYLFDEDKIEENLDKGLDFCPKLYVETVKCNFTLTDINSEGLKTETKKTKCNSLMFVYGFDLLKLVLSVERS